MKLICRDEHDTSDICPPHEFEAAWSTTDTDNGGGVIFCKWCGDVRELLPPKIEASILESEPVKKARND